MKYREAIWRNLQTGQEGSLLGSGRKVNRMKLHTGGVVQVKSESGGADWSSREGGWVLHDPERTRTVVQTAAALRATLPSMPRTASTAHWVLKASRNLPMPSASALGTGLPVWTERRSCQELRQAVSALIQAYSDPVGLASPETFRADQWKLVEQILKELEGSEPLQAWKREELRWAAHRAKIASDG